MGFAFATPVPAVSITGDDQYLIVAMDGTDCICVDQDGDMRVVNMSDLKTKWLWLAELEVWTSTQADMNDLELVPDEQDAGE